MGWTIRWRAASVVQSVPVSEMLTSPPFVLNGRLVVRNDGDDVFFKVGRQAEGHGIDLEIKERDT